MAEKNIYSEAESMSENLPKVSVFAVSTENLDLEKALSDYSELISQARMKKIKRLAHLDDKKLSFCAELALCFALKSVSLPYAPPVYSYSLLGKPQLTEESFHINISHSGSMAVCAISVVPIGVDVLESDAYIANKVYKRIVSSSDETPFTKHELLSLWTKKESYVKLIGSGLRTPMTSFYVASDRVTSKIGCAPAYITFTEISDYFLSIASYEKISAEYFFLTADDFGKLCE